MNTLQFKGQLDFIVRITLVLCLIFSSQYPQNSFAQNLETQQQIRNLNQAYDNLSFTNNEDESLQIVRTAMDSFFSEMNPADELRSPEGYTLLKKQRKLLNFLAVKKILETCTTKDQKGRLLSTRIIEATAASSHAQIDCSTPLTNVEKLTQAVALVLDQPLIDNFENSLHEQVLLNSLATFIHIKTALNPELRAQEVVDDFCVNQKKSCSTELQQQLLKKAGQLLVNERRSNNRISRPESAANELNEFINSKEFKSKEAIGPEDIKGAKVLLLSQTLQNIVKKKSLLKADDIVHSVQEISDSIKAQVGEINKMHSQSGKNKTQEKNLKRLLRTHPAAVGQLLMNDPEKAYLVCNLIKKIDQDDIKDEKINNAFLWGGLIVGGVLLVTGVLSWAGAMTLSAAGASAGAITAANTLAAATTVASLGTGLTEAGFQGYKAYNSQQEKKDLEKALLTRNGDKLTPEEIQRSIKEYNEAKIKGILSLGLSALDLSTIASLAKAGYLSNATSSINRLLSDSAMAQKILAARKMLTPEEMSQFFSHLIQMPANSLKSFIESCKKMSPQDFINFIKNLGAKIGTGITHYSKDVWRTKGLRLIVKPRDTTNPPKGLHYLNSMLFNPIATTFNRPRELTLPATMVAWNYLVDRPTLAREEARKAETLGVSNQLPGSELIEQLRNSQELDSQETTAIVSEHRNNLDRWKRGKAHLPRSEQMVKNNIINKDEADTLNSIAINLYNQALQIKNAENLDSEFYLNLSLKLSETLKNHPQFSKKTETEIDLLSTLFWPNIKIGKHTDVELTKALMTSSSVQQSFEQQQAIQTVYNLFDKNEIDLGAALVMTQKIIDQPNDLKMKRKKATAVLPQNKLYLSSRPDIPYLAKEFTFNSNDHKPMTLKDEMDWWQLLLKDHRFSDIKEAWQSDIYSDATAIYTLNASIKSLNQIYQIQNRSTQNISDQDLNSLYGLNSDQPNAYFEELQASILKAKQERKLNLEQTKSCMKSIAILWINFHSERKKWATEKERQEFEALNHNLIELTRKKNDEILRTCGE